MGKQTSLDIRRIIIDLQKKGKSLREIGKIVGRSHNTVKNIIDKYAKHHTLENLAGAGRPKRLSITDERAVVREVKENPTSSAVKISEKMSETLAKPVSASTIRRVLHNNGLHGRTPRKKPYISKINQYKRMNYVKKYETEPLSFWERILFSDESKFEIFGTKKPPKIWRSKNEAFKEKNIKTIKHII